MSKESRIFVCDRCNTSAANRALGHELFTDAPPGWAGLVVRRPQGMGMRSYDICPACFASFFDYMLQKGKA